MYRIGALVGGRDAADAVVAADASGRAAFAVGQRTDRRKSENDLRAIHFDAGKHALNHRQQILNFGIRCQRLVGIVNANIGRADQHAIEERQNQHDAAVVIFEEEFAFARRLEQVGIIQDQVRALCAADEALFARA